MPQRKWLSRYAEVFSTVEINITYRRDLTEETAAAWLAATPSDFRFVLKAHQRATHFHRLKSAHADIELQVAQARLLGERLGLVYFQMPHNFLRDDDLLDRFLAAWPHELPTVWEFGHPSWHVDDVQTLLSGHSAGWVMSDARTETPAWLATGDDVYVRLRREAYSAADLKAIATQLRQLEGQRGWIFVRHGADAPELAQLVQQAVAGE